MKKAHDLNKKASLWKKTRDFNDNCWYVQCEPIRNRKVRIYPMPHYATVMMLKLQIFIGASYWFHVVYHLSLCHDDVIKCRHFLHCWPFVKRIHWSPVVLLTKNSDVERWCFLWSAPEQTVEQIYRDNGALRHHRSHYGVVVKLCNTGNDALALLYKGSILIDNGSKFE